MTCRNKVKNHKDCWDVEQHLKSTDVLPDLLFCLLRSPINISFRLPSSVRSWAYCRGSKKKKKKKLEVTTAG